MISWLSLSKVHKAWKFHLKNIWLKWTLNWYHHPPRLTFCWSYSKHEFLTLVVCHAQKSTRHKWLHTIISHYIQDHSSTSQSLPKAYTLIHHENQGTWGEGGLSKEENAISSKHIYNLQICNLPLQGYQ